MQYEIKGGAFPVVVCRLEDGEQMITERGSMVWQTPNIRMETTGGGIGKMFSKALSGESIFQNIYTAQGTRNSSLVRLPTGVMDRNSPFRAPSFSMTEPTLSAGTSTTTRSMGSHFLPSISW